MTWMPRSGIRKMGVVVGLKLRAMWPTSGFWRYSTFTWINVSVRINDPWLKGNVFGQIIYVRSYSLGYRLEHFLQWNGAVELELNSFFLQQNNLMNINKNLSQVGEENWDKLVWMNSGIDSFQVAAAELDRVGLKMAPRDTYLIQLGVWLDLSNYPTQFKSFAGQGLVSWIKLIFLLRVSLRNRFEMSRL